jgi:hypothetical protein
MITWSSWIHLLWSPPYLQPFSEAEPMEFSVLVSEDKSILTGSDHFWEKLKEMCASLIL